MFVNASETKLFANNFHFKPSQAFSTLAFFPSHACNALGSGFEERTS